MEPYTTIRCDSCWFLWTNAQRIKREPGVNPGLPRSGKRERNPPHALVPRDWEAVGGRDAAKAETLTSPKTCLHLEPERKPDQVDLEASWDGG
jgi:hypothetical protein